ncbi:ribose-phosphate diphosphokinase [Candidatus Woesearchaeota archaeon]|nr:ribose-phosphate diphosphokinase [Candidatus Woesearchaeota archaeon]
MDKSLESFTTPKDYKRQSHEYEDLWGPDGWLLFVACDSGKDLAMKVKKEYINFLKKKESNMDVLLLDGNMTRYFEDHTTIPRLPSHVANSNAFVFQNATENISGRTPGENFNQLLQMVRTLKVHGASNINVVMPYLTHPRQEKPSFMQREATLAKLDADLLKTAGTNTILTYHPHSLATQGFYEPEIRFVYLSGLDLFMDVFKEEKNKDNVIVFSTDAGGVDFTKPYSDFMGIEYGVTIKHRAKQKKTDTLGLAGEIQGKSKAIIIDDETATLGSFIGTTERLVEDHRFHEIYWGVSHMKLKEDCIGRLKKANKEYNVKEVHITDTIAQTKKLLDLDFIISHSIAERFARTINRMHYGKSVSQIFYKPD